MKIKDIEIIWLGHASFKIKTNKIIYIDPYKIPETEEKAGIILITHSHFDHCSITDISKIAKDGSIIISPADCQSKITKSDKKINMQVMEIGEKIKIENIKISSVPAYNKNKQFHPKSEAWLGFILEINSVIIYHAGDTDFIPEMKKLTGFRKKGIEFIALLPVGGTYTMNADEAAQAASIIKPSLAIPMHFGEVVGERKDAETFKKLCEENNIKCQILEMGK